MQNAFLLAAAAVAAAAVADFALAPNSSNMMTCPPTANTYAAAAHLSVFQKRISFTLCFFIWLDLTLERISAAAAAANAEHYF